MRKLWHYILALLNRFFDEATAEELEERAIRDNGHSHLYL